LFKKKIEKKKKKKKKEEGEIENIKKIKNLIFYALLYSKPLGYNSRFVWSSIWKARQILLIGCMGSICDGDKINIMKSMVAW
jgi:hypothetical protein